LNAISVVSLIDALLTAFEAVFPKATTLDHATGVVEIVGAAVEATQPADGADDPAVTAITSALPTVVESVQAIRAAVNAPATAAPGAESPAAPVVSATPAVATAS